MLRRLSFIDIVKGLLLGSIFFFGSCGGSGEAQDSSAPAKKEKAVENVRTTLRNQSTLEKIVKSGELRVGFEAGYMPFEMADKEGKFVGFDMDMARAMAKAMGVKFVPVNTAWDGIIPSLMTDKFDIIIGGMTITQERNLQINFADPYIVVGQTILVSKKKDPKGKIKSFKDLNKKGYIVTSRLGTTGEQAIKKYIPKCRYKSFEAESEAALEVINGKAHAFVYDLPYCEVLYSTHGEKKVNFLNEPFTYEPLGWAINKGDPDFLNWLNNFLRQVRNDGRYEKMYNKWIKSTDWKKEVE